MTDLFPPMARPETRFLHPGLHGSGSEKTFVLRSNFLRLTFIELKSSRIEREKSDRKKVDQVLHQWDTNFVRQSVHTDGLICSYSYKGCCTAKQNMIPSFPK